MPKSPGQAVRVPVGQQVVTTQAAKMTLYPFAEDLEAYNRAIPNGAERLFNNFDNQSTHRQGMENKVVESNIRQAEMGQKMGFFVILVALGSAVWMARTGHDAVAITIVTVVLAGGFGVFITGRVQQIQDLRRKQQQAEKAQIQ
jgi:uncharacterized membrane protein